MKATDKSSKASVGAFVYNIKKVGRMRGSRNPNTLSRREFINWRDVKRHFVHTWELYLFVLPAVVFIFIFKYMPIYGLRIAFTDGFSLRAGRSAPEWNNFANFIRFFDSAYFWPVLRNTLGIALYSLAMWPVPLVLAIMMNHLRSSRFKKTIQMVTYAPHFISTVVVVGMMYVFLNPRFGVMNTVLSTLTGGDPIFFMGDPGMAKSLLVFSNVWQNAGYGAIIFIAALSGVDESAKEAAFCDGASTLRIIWSIEIPWIIPTILIMFIMRIGALLAVGFEKILLMQNPMNIQALEVVSTYVYRAGILDAQYEYTAAVTFLEAIINFTLLVIANRTSKRLIGVSLW